MYAFADYIVLKFIHTNLHFTNEDFGYIALLSNLKKSDHYLESEERTNIFIVQHDSLRILNILMGSRPNAYM